MKTHHLKTINPFFQNVWMKRKTAELRFNDRDFQIGDTLILEEYLEGTKEFTGREIIAEITDILKDAPQYGLMEGYCMISFKIIIRSER